MTDMHEQELECPACGHSQNAVVYETINVTLDPELKEKLFKGQLNLFVCEECGHRAIMNLVFLYHDMEKKFCVQYCPFEKVLRKDEQLAEMYTINGEPQYLYSLQLPEIAEYMLEPHIVLSLDEMVRYVQFRDVIYEQLKEARTKH